MNISNNKISIVHKNWNGNKKIDNVSFKKLISDLNSAQKTNQETPYFKSWYLFSKFKRAEKQCE